jgi:hypothetical protein
LAHPPRRGAAVLEPLGEQQRTLAIGKIADVLEKQGDLDEALRIRRH